MKIWELNTDVNHYETYITKFDEDMNKISFDYKFNGTCIKDRWIPIEIEILSKKKKKEI